MDHIGHGSMRPSISSSSSHTEVPTPSEYSEGERGHSTPATSTEDDNSLSLHDDTNDSVAIIGMACRVPGDVKSPSELWKFLLQKGDASGDMPSWRWDPYRRRHPRNTDILAQTTSKGYFLHDIEQFDASFFSISPREAEQMDPQQRIALEVAWEALENAGISPLQLAGSNTAVYMGVNSDDYGKLILEDLPNVGAHMGVGTAYCGIPSRISYVLDLMGPSVALDAACASSLVAVHHARQAIRAGETDLAIAGGVNALLGPGLTRVLDEAGAISADGKCRSFDDNAHGYGRGEGSGVVILKNLGKALADGDHVLAVLKGSAVCSDGKTVGIMAPNPHAQVLVANKALSEAKVTPDSINYIEAHATSTALGDPTETNALAAVYGIGSGRDPSAPCYIGSIKPNIGHLEAGAGIMGLIKAVLVLQNGQVPPQANLQILNQKVAWHENLLQCSKEVATLSTSGARPLRAAIASYGYSGIVSHAIIEASTRQQPFSDRLARIHSSEKRTDASPVLLLLSAPQASRVSSTAGSLRHWLHDNEDSVSLATVASTLSQRRAHHRFRHSIVAESISEAIVSLENLTKDIPSRWIVNDRVSAEATKGPVWVFSGHGAQWAEMGRELFQSCPAFIDVVHKLEPIIQAELGFSAIETLRSGCLDHSDVIQAMTFLMHLGIAAVLEEASGPPSAVVGHSLGEAAAAVVSGALTWHEGALIVCRRAQLYREFMGKGAMVLVRMSADDARSHIGTQSTVGVAIEASPTACVVSGTVDAIEELAEKWRQEGIEVRPVASDVPFHTPLLEKLAGPLRDALKDELHPRVPHLPLYSTSQLDPRSVVLRDVQYWVTNMVQPVRLHPTVTAMVNDGFRVFVEVSSHPIVTQSIVETIGDQTQGRFLVTPTMVRKQPARKSILMAVGRLHCFGCSVKYTDLDPNAHWSSDIPGTLWNHQPFYRTVSEISPTQLATTHDPAANDLLGSRTALWGTEQILYQTCLDESNRPFPGHHPLYGSEIVPAAVLLRTFLKALSPNCVEEVSLKVPVVVSPSRDIQIRHDSHRIAITSRLHLSAATLSDDDGAWIVNTTGKVGAPGAIPSLPHVDLAAIRRRLSQTLSNNFSIDYLASVGVSAMGFPWKVVNHVASDDEMLAQVYANPETEPGMKDSWTSIMDAATSIASTLWHRKPQLRMPTAVRRVVSVPGIPNPQAVYIYCVKARSADDTADISICGEDGNALIEFHGMAFAGVEGESFSRKSISGLIHHVSWPPATFAEQPLDFSHVAFLMTDADEKIKTRIPHYQRQLETRGISSSVHLAASDLPLENSCQTIVVYLPQAAIYADKVFDAAARSCDYLVSAAKAITSTSARLFVITETGSCEMSSDMLAYSPIYGLSRIIQSEHPDIWGGLVEVEDRDVFPLMAIRYVRNADVIKIHDGVPRTARLRPLVSPPGHNHSQQLTFSAAGTYLITGGLGALGLEVARWMVEQGARRLLLVSRRKLPPRSLWKQQDSPGSVIERILTLERLGATIHVLSVDISRPDGATALEAAIERVSLPPVTGVIHAAGVLHDQLLENITIDAFNFVLAPKIQGALNLHSLFPPGTTDFFVLFSSCGQLLGFPGQASYASGNAFLDALAVYRRRQGDHAMSMLWTSWCGMGMAASTEYINAELHARGITDITTEEAFLAWRTIASLDTDHAVILRARPLDATEPLPHPILRDIAPRRLLSPSAGPEQKSELTEIKKLTGPDLEEQLERVITACVSRALAIAESDVDASVALAEMGMDSVMTVTFRTQLQQALNTPVGPTLIWKCPTVRHLVQHFGKELAASA